jgi:DNA/RNA-binding domain of Phe-tRNA-synthetase-like protein
MKKFIITDAFWEVFPQAEIAVVLAKGIQNTEAHAADVRQEINELLEKSSKEAKKFLTEEVFSENKVISVWRQAFQQFKTKKGVRCSIEALLKRIEKGTGVSPINPLVDIYNAVSLTYGLPCGGEDIDTFKGDLLLAKAVGGEAFLALGDEEHDNALPGEIIYKDAEGAVCRCWNWRDGQRTMLTEDTVNAFLIIESVDPGRSSDLKAAASTLAELTVKYLGGSAELALLDSNHRELTL